MTKNKKELFDKIEGFDWAIEKEEENSYRLSKYSPVGQDFSISIEGENVKELIDDIYEAYVDFDVSEETYLWLDDSGHGKNGAPYEMKDVLEDMEACKQMIVELYSNLS